MSPLYDVVLLDELRTTMDAIRVPLHPAFCMLSFAACLCDKVRVYDFATGRTEADWGIVASVIKIRAQFPHFLVASPSCIVYRQIACPEDSHI